MKWINLGYPKAKVLRIVGVARSTYYYWINKKTIKRAASGGRPIPGYSYTLNGTKIYDEQIKELLLKLIENEGYAYGYYKLTIILKRKTSLIINKKKVYRLCKELNILRPQRQIKAKHPRKLARNRTITGSNQLWETDLKYGYISGEQRFFFIQSMLDIYDRTIVGYHIGLQCSGQDAARVLEQSLWDRKLFYSENKPVIRSDNGPQFTSHKFQNKVNDLEMEHERIPFRMPNLNAHIESFHRILEDDCLSRYEFDSYEEAYSVVTEFIRFYNEQRIHSSIGYLTPSEFYDNHLTNGLTTREIRV